jgi:hypothetical protein
MALHEQILNNVRIQSRNDIATNWTSENPILLKGELGIELDTRRVKIGTGITAWNDLLYATVTPEQVEALDRGDMHTDLFATSPEAAQGWVDKALEAKKLSDAVTVAVSGDVATVTPVSFDGTENITLGVALKEVIEAGVYTKVTVNEKGLVVDFDDLEPSDIPDLTLAKITDAGTAASRNVGDAVGNVVVLDAGGLINSKYIGALHVVSVHEVADKEEMVALAATQGDIAIVNLATGTEVYMLADKDPEVETNWKRLNIPTGSIISINGLQGPAVTLTTTNIEEGINLYYTEARATANFNTNIATIMSTDLANGEDILLATDMLILNGGGAASA